MLHLRPVGRFRVASGIWTAAVMVAVCGSGSGVQAQSFWDNSTFGARPSVQQRQARQQPAARPRRSNANASGRSARPAPEREAVGDKAVLPGSELVAVINLGSQRMSVFDSTGEILQSRISSGKAGHRTPKGVFHILQKRRYHESNIYSGAPMPFMQRLTWSGIALHAGVVPGYPASHGCIRLPTGVAARLFKMTKMGMRVVVSPGSTRAVPIAHPALPAPVMVAASSVGANDRQAGHGVPVQLAAAEPPTVGGSTTDGPALGLSQQSATSELLNPMQRARLERERSRAAVKAAEQTAKAALQEARELAERADDERERLAELVVSVGAAEADLAREAAAEATAPPEAQTGAVERRAAAAVRVADLRRALKEARGLDEVLRAASFEAAVASRNADEALTQAKAAAAAAARGTNAVAVFVSRKTGKLYVRQGYEPVFEAAVAFKSPDQPIGTHLFMAMAADDASGQVTWKAISVPETGGSQAGETRRPVKRGYPAAADERAPSGAKEALERLIIEPAVMREVASRLWAGASIIVSDHGIGNETGKYTDFVILTR